MYGQKIDNLFLLKRAGLNVPDFEVVKFMDVIDDYAAFEEYYLLKLRLPSRQASREIAAYLSEHLIVDFVTDMKSDLFAVRSASNIEDGDVNSFAGQFDTYLNIPPKMLNRKILECFLSLSNENVLAYIKKQDISISHIEMNVIVQKMVEPDCAGVLFTANPQGLLNEMVIVVGEGLGENIVSDKAQTTSYYYNKTDDIYYFEGKRNLLQPNLLHELVKCAADIELVLGKNLDIEFAINDGKIYILQARKITTIDDSAPLVLDNSNIVESYPGISLPLTISFAEMVYAGVFEALCRRVVKDDELLDRYKPIFSEMVGSSNGRLYYKISNWYNLIDFLPFRRQITPMWEEMLGLEHSSRKPNKISAVIHARVAKNYLHELRHVPESMEQLNDFFDEFEKRFKREFSEELNLAESLKYFHHVADELFSRWDITLINDMYAFINVGLLKKRLGDKANSLIANISNLESMEPVRAMIELAYRADKISKAAYREAFDAYIDQFGDRNVEELKLESQTFRTNPKLLEARIQEYRNNPQRLEELYQSIQQVSPDYAENKLLARCKVGIRNREISRLNRSRIYGIARRIMLHVGSLLAKQKAIAQKDDVFYLRIEELDRFVKTEFDLKKIVKERKADYEIYRQLPSYSKLIFAKEEFDKHHASINSFDFNEDKNRLVGTPCSDGLVSAKVVLVDDPKKHPDTQGKIVVTRSTDPGWVFMLSTAKGVISERGSLLSHTAIISRELGIPSIVGVKNLTKLLKTGDRVTMNGKTGEIKIESRAK